MGISPGLEESAELLKRPKSLLSCSFWLHRMVKCQKFGPEWNEAVNRPLSETWFQFFSGPIYERNAEMISDDDVFLSRSDEHPSLVPPTEWASSVGTKSRRMPQARRGWEDVHPV